jgi:hypothetical protein
MLPPRDGPDGWDRALPKLRNPSGFLCEAVARYQRFMAREKVLFCPFCRESFEGEAACPEHEIPLVPFDKLPRSELDAVDDDGAPAQLADDSVLATFDPRLGRLWVGLGALLNAAALALVFARNAQGRAVRTYELASYAPSLWTLLLVSFTLLFVLKRRRTPRALRGLRVLVPALAWVSPITVAWVLFRLRAGLVPHVRLSNVDPGVAVALVLIAALLVFVGGLRLGVLPRSAQPEAVAQ